MQWKGAQAFEIIHSFTNYSSGTWVLFFQLVRIQHEQNNTDKAPALWNLYSGCWRRTMNSKKLYCILESRCYGSKQRRVRGIRISNFQNDVFEKMQILEGEQPRQSPRWELQVWTQGKRGQCGWVNRARRRLRRWGQRDNGGGTHHAGPVGRVGRFSK